MFNSANGGTGAGFGSLLLDRLSNDYGKNVKLNYSVYPNKSAVMCALPVWAMQYYNSVLFSASTLEHSDLSIILDNESIFNVCKKGGFNLDYYNADTINRIIAL